MCTSWIGMMLALFLAWLLCFNFVQGKAFREGYHYEGNQNYYNQEVQPQFQPYYGHFAPNVDQYYSPQLNGQPIFIPPSSGSDNYASNYLDDYYKANKEYTQSWTLATPIAYSYDHSENYYENSATANSMVKNLLHEAYDNGVYQGSNISPTTQGSTEKYEPKKPEKEFKDEDKNIKKPYIRTKGKKRPHAVTTENSVSEPYKIKSKFSGKYPEEDKFPSKTEHSSSEVDYYDETNKHDTSMLVKHEVKDKKQVNKSSSKTDYKEMKSENKKNKLKPKEKNKSKHKSNKPKNEYFKTAVTKDSVLISEKLNEHKTEKAKVPTKQNRYKILTKVPKDKYDLDLVDVVKLSDDKEVVNKLSDDYDPEVEEDPELSDDYSPEVVEVVNKLSDDYDPEEHLLSSDIEKDETNTGDAFTSKKEKVENKKKTKDKSTIDKSHVQVTKTSSVSGNLNEMYKPKNPSIKPDIYTNSIKTEVSKPSKHDKHEIVARSDDYDPEVVDDESDYDLEEVLGSSDKENLETNVQDTFTSKKEKIKDKSSNADKSYIKVTKTNTVAESLDELHKPKKPSINPDIYAISKKTKIESVSKSPLKHVKHEVVHLSDDYDPEVVDGIELSDDYGPEVVDAVNDLSDDYDTEEVEGSLVKENDGTKVQSTFTSKKENKKVKKTKDKSSNADKIHIKSEKKTSKKPETYTNLKIVSTKTESITKSPSIQGEYVSGTHKIEKKDKNVLEDKPIEDLEIVHSRELLGDQGTNIPNEFEEFDLENPSSGDEANEENLMRVFPFNNMESIKSLTSANSNIWSLISNPNAERSEPKKCITRSNETGFCTYIQQCEVPNIVTSLEQLLQNSCVIDDIFIGICCPEFPVQTVKVHWEQMPSNTDKQIEDDFDQNSDDCGVRSDEATKAGSWPWQAPLVSMSNGKIFCGGVVMNEDYVLTAAHCTTKIPKNQILVRLGQHDESSGDDFAVVEIKRHAQYNPRTMNHDVALLKLGRRIPSDTHTGAICLPDDDDEDHDEEKAILLGWKSSFGKGSNQTELLEVMSNEECEKKLGSNVLASKLCTEARNENERTCNIDSGAPLVVEDDGKYEVIGILSWNRNDCDQRFPSTFSRVSRYVKWIEKHAV